MPHHPPLTIAFTVGSDAEGLQLDSELTGELFTNSNANQIAAQSRDLIHQLIVWSTMLKRGDNAANAQAFVDSHLTVQH